MSQQQNFFDQIGPYLDNQLSAAEKLEFDKQVQQDPLLKGEFQFQEDVIHSIRNYRTLQLKGRFDNIVISPPSSFISNNLAAIKIISTIALISFIGTGSYFYFQNETEQAGSPVANDIELSESKTLAEPITVAPEITDEVSEEPQSETTQTPETINDSPAVNTPPAKERAPVIQKERAPSEPIATAKTTRNIEPVVVEGFDDQETLPSAEELDLPNKEDLLDKNIEEISRLEVTSKNDGKHAFHYQHYNNKLFLYGEFNNIPYEILELNKIDGKELFLFYQDEFYNIMINQIEIAPLEKIEDKGLIGRLTTLLQNRQ